MAMAPTKFQSICPFVVDRKSTRLNSSHSQISYAVFCLKKKKNKLYVDDLAYASTHYASLPRRTQPHYATPTSLHSLSLRRHTFLRTSSLCLCGHEYAF